MFAGGDRLFYFWFMAIGMCYKTAFTTTSIERWPSDEKDADIIQHSQLTESTFYIFITFISKDFAKNS